MEERYTVNLSANEINFVADAIDSYAFTISRLIDVESRDSIGKILQNIFSQFDSIINLHQSQTVTDNEVVIIDVEPEVVSYEESEEE